MKRLLIFMAGLALGALIMLLLHPVVFAPAITAVFSPEDGHEIINYVDSAHESIDIEMYVFSSRDVVEALERAKSRGVDVRIIIEKNVVGGENDQIYRELCAKGFKIRFASESFKLTHSKFIIIDKNAVLVGSHNLSNSALFRNREASVIIRDVAILREFMDVFENDWKMAT